MTTKQEVLNSPLPPACLREQVLNASIEAAETASWDDASGSTSSTWAADRCTELVNVVDAAGASAFIAIKEDEPLSFETRRVLWCLNREQFSDVCILPLMTTLGRGWCAGWRRARLFDRLFDRCLDRCLRLTQQGVVFEITNFV